MFFRTVSRPLVLVLLASAPFQTIGTAALPNKGMPQSSAPAPVAKAGCTMQVLTNTEGVDFNQYLREVYLSVKKRWFANMPPSVEKGDQGVDSVEFRILQDGSVPKDCLKVVVSSRKTALDEASLQGIREAVPFSHLPEKFSQPFVELRFVFYYNLPIPQNK
jgi:outer membrane biosynthesis protein TonB